MFSTSLTTATVAGLLATGSLANQANQPTWQTSYRTALTQAGEQKKPIAVFIGRGGAGYAKLIADGGLGADAARALRKNYVCLYVDTGTASGKELAGAFQMGEGLVISDKTGGVQVLRHEGTVSKADLAGYLTRFVDPGKISQTEYRGSAQAVVQSAPVTAQPVYQPVYQPQMVLNPVMSFRSFAGGG